MSRRDKGGGGGHGGGGEERWLLPYADMITLLLGLFIVLFAMSSVDDSKFDNVRRSLAQTFKGSVLEESGGVLPGSDGVMDPTDANQTPDNTVVQQLELASNATRKRFNDEEGDLKRLVKQANLQKDVSITRTERGIVVRLAGDALFDTGSSALRPAMASKLERVAKELKAFGSPIEITGHTDGQRFNSRYGNWGLSGDRAQEVRLLFHTHGFPDGLMRVSGVADTQPLVPPSRPNQSIEKNRRIEITILEPGADDASYERMADKAAAEAAKANAVAPTSKRPSSSTQSEPTAKQRAQAEVDEGIVEQLASTSKAVA